MANTQNTKLFYEPPKDSAQQLAQSFFGPNMYFRCEAIGSGKTDEARVALDYMEVRLSTQVNNKIAYYLKLKNIE